MKLAILTDTHLGIRNNSPAFMNNADEFYNKIFFPTCVNEGVEQILHLGDYYDVRRGTSTLALDHNKKSFIDRLNKVGIPFDIITGNHDCFFKNTNTPNTLETILKNQSELINVISNPEVKEYGSLRIGLVPWICEENSIQSFKFIENAQCDWLAGHFAFNGFINVGTEEINHGHDPSLVDRFDQVLSGHYHKSSSKGNIYYIGSPLQFTWADVDDDKHFLLVDTETREIKRIVNNNTIFKTIRYTDEIVEGFDFSSCKKHFVQIIVKQSDDDKKMKKFITEVENSDIHHLRIIDNPKLVSGMDNDVEESVDDDNIDDESFKNIEEIISIYIKQMTLEDRLDRDVLKNIMMSIHTKAEEGRISS